MPLVGLAALAAIAWATSSAPNPPRASGTAWASSLGRPGRRRARRQVDCCDAESDDWRAAWDVYRRWSANALGFNAAYVECFRDSVEAAAAGDYGKPADRRCILGKMHGAKQAAWLACRRGCRGQRGDDGVEVLDDLAGTVYTRDGDTYLVRTDERGDWLLERYDRRGPSRIIGRWESFAAADARARELLTDVPF